MVHMKQFVIYYNGRRTEMSARSDRLVRRQAARKLDIPADCMWAVVVIQIPQHESRPDVTC